MENLNFILRIKRHNYNINQNTTAMFIIFYHAQTPNSEIIL